MAHCHCVARFTKYEHVKARARKYGVQVNIHGHRIGGMHFDMTTWLYESEPTAAHAHTTTNRSVYCCFIHICCGAILTVFIFNAVKLVVL